MNSKPTVSGKTLKWFNSWHKDTPQKDKSGNILTEGDLVFHVTCGRYSTYSIKTILLLREDVTGEEFLGVKLDNGQFAVANGVELFKVDANFAKLHSSYVSTKHLG